MMMVGHGLHFAPGLGGLRFWAFCLGDFQWPCVGLRGGEALGFLLPWVVLTAVLAWTRGTRTSQLLYLFNTLLFLDFRTSASKHMLYNLGEQWETVCGLSNTLALHVGMTCMYIKIAIIIVVRVS